MDCLICNNVNFDVLNPIDQKISPTLCKLLDIQLTTFVNSSICPACCDRLLEIHGLFNQLEVIKVKLDHFRSKIIEYLFKAQGTTQGQDTELDERTKIIEEIRSKVYEEPYNDGPSSKIKAEKEDDEKENILESDIFSNFDYIPDTDLAFDFEPPIITTKNAQIILERIQLPPPESMKNSYNIKQEPIASFITRDQPKFIIKNIPVKNGRGRPQGSKSTPKVSKSPPKKKIKATKSTSKFKCEFCSNVYTRPDNLKRHLISHTNPEERPFPCPKCQDKFKTKDGLIKHDNAKHLKKKIFCEKCERYLNPQNGAFYRHQTLPICKNRAKILAAKAAKMKKSKIV